MNLKNRLIVANTATVVIPIMATVLFVLVFLFIQGKFFGIDVAYESFRELSVTNHVVMSSEQEILKQSPEGLEKEGFQQYLRGRLAAIGGEVIIIKSEQVQFASRNFTKFDLAQITQAGKSTNSNELVHVGNATYRVHKVASTLDDTKVGSIMFLIPVVVDTAFGIDDLLWVSGIVFILTFALMNIVVSWRFSRRVLRPLSSLRSAAEEISAGNLDCQIPETGDEELQVLCRDLELMRIKLKESIHTQLKFEDNRKLLVSSISHDLKTPVTAIKGYVEGILDGIANTPEKNERYLKTIYAKAQLVDHMIDDLLLYAKLDLKQMPFNFERTEITDYLQTCLAECEQDVERSKIRLVMHNELSDQRWVLLDRERMRRVVMNVLDNSCKYANKEQGDIQVMLRETNSSITIEVRDNGSGISPDDLPHIFDRFFRSDIARSGTNGSGLGLAIAKQIVEGHSGRIWALSHGEDGTSILISLAKVN